MVVVVGAVFCGVLMWNGIIVDIHVCCNFYNYYRYNVLCVFLWSDILFIMKKLCYKHNSFSLLHVKLKVQEKKEF